MLVFHEDLMPVLLSSATSSLILTEVDKFNDIRMIDVSPAHKLSMAADHFLFSAVVEVILIDEFFCDGVAIWVVIEFEPVLDHKTWFLLETVAHFSFAMPIIF